MKLCRVNNGFQVIIARLMANQVWLGQLNVFISDASLRWIRLCNVNYVIHANFIRLIECVEEANIDRN